MTGLSVVIGRGVGGDVYYNVTGDNVKATRAAFTEIDKEFYTETEDRIDVVLDAVDSFEEPPNMTELKDALPWRTMDHKRGAIAQAERSGFITRTKETRGRSVRVELTTEGKARLNGDA